MASTHTSAGVVEILVKELLRRMLARKSFPVSCLLSIFAKQRKPQEHTSLAALAMSEKEAGADIMNVRGVVNDNVGIVKVI